MTPPAAHLLLRADADVARGNGHVMRCLALADAWQQLGGKATFLTHTDSPTLLAQICAAGHELAPLPHPFPHGEDMTDTIEAMRARGATCLVLDGYHFDRSFHSAIRSAGLCLLVIDDNAHLPYYDADMVLNQNLHARELTYHVPASCRLLAGPRYALLRPEFAAGAAQRRRVAVAATRILVTLGGSDPHNVTATVLAALNKLGEGANAARLKVKVVVGPGNPHRIELEKLRQTICLDLELITPHASVTGARGQLTADHPATMSELMAWADIAVSAAGSTCWELGRMGLPAVLIVTADNQERIARALAEHGSAIAVGRHDGLTAEGIAAALSALLSDRPGRQEMRRAGRRLVDGRGATRVAEFVLERVLKAMAGHAGTNSSTHDSAIQHRTARNR